MLNTIGWVTFYWHWKHITLWQEIIYGETLHNLSMDITLLFIGLGVDVLIWTSCLGYWIYVLNFLAWLLAGID
ncbi:hypothetical protein IEQ34_024215 [Dendrobium chrysotoxum]|uniref:Uncharacterized protein n=1 Tax=Dendrobium chrysotoxum TaxID=161865 RepID=A0AAV7FUD3_DENCH|nr:hypothetical protein IEQ34_024215 [Dendrobium chrysotoxum]